MPNPDQTIAAPTVSVIIAAYNAHDTLADCIRSVRVQTISEIEILIVDDKSTDNTLEVAHALQKQDPRIKIFEMPENGGPASARNRGLDGTSGEWIAIVDSDDTISPDRLEKMLAAAKKNNVDIVFDNLVYHPMGKHASYNYLPDTLKIFSHLPGEIYMRSGCLPNPLPNLGFLKPLIRKQRMQSAAIRYNQNLRVGEDSLMIFDLFAAGAQAWLLKDAMYHYYKHKNSISTVFDSARILGMANAIEAFRSKNTQNMSREMLDAAHDFEKDLRERLKAKESLASLSPVGLCRAASQALREKQSRLYLYREFRHRVKRLLTG